MSFSRSLQPGKRSLHAGTKTSMVLVLAWMGLITGCGSPEPARWAISGTILLDGKPVGPVLITLVPTTPEQIGCTIASQDGQFEVPSMRGPSAGHFDVIVSTLEPDLEEFETRRSANRSLFNPVLIPAKYQRAGELKIEIQPELGDKLKLVLVSN